MAAWKSRSKELYFLDLFAGSGGFSLGLEASGFTSLGSVEINPKARETLQTNFGESPLSAIRSTCGDVRKLDFKKLKKDLSRAGIPELDLLVACPPCQGFSRIGRAKLDSLAGSKGSHPADPRNKLYQKVIKCLEIIRPKAFVFENVPGMLSVGGRNVAEIVCKQADKAGYQVKAALLNAAWYGVPQLRERIIIIGYRKDLGITPDFPTIEFNGPEIEGHMSGSDGILKLWKSDEYFINYSCLRSSLQPKKFKTVEEALADIPSFTTHLQALRYGRKYKSLRELHPPVPYKPGCPNEYCKLMRDWTGFESSSVSDHCARWTPRDFRIFRRMKEGDRYPEALAIANFLWRQAKRQGQQVKRKEYVPPYPDDSFKEKWRKLIRNRPSWTLTAHLSKDSYSHIHFDSTQARAISIREAARLQSFPDGFKFVGCAGDVFMQIGNAVPPLLSKAIGKEIRKTLNKNQKTARTHTANHWEVSL